MEKPKKLKIEKQKTTFMMLPTKKDAAKGKGLIPIETEVTIISPDQSPTPVVWHRYRFRTKSVEDTRPLVFDPRFPFWCSGYGMNADFEEDHAIIIGWLPKGEPLEKYYDDAYDVEFHEFSEIKFTDRFPKPDHFQPYESF